ncbi:MAG TPA: HNH endonuclease signature motif containing protein, partial [Intrasporangium sp.]|nr:HNH endonuclease signature motif containing protein [Intrasporangium sp.]
GRSQRLFTGKQKLAMAVGQPHCRADGCTVPATWCEAHHLAQPWATGGKTDINDGKLLCGWHHHRAHDDRYLVNLLPNGDIRFRRRR